MTSRMTATLRGIGRFEPRWTRDNIVEADATYTEAGPRPGVPDAEGNLTARVAGAQEDDLELRVQRAGYPGADSATVAYRIGDESAVTDWRGWNTPSVIADWVAAVWATSGGNAAHGLTVLPDSQRPVVLYADGNWQTRTWSWSSEAWGSAVTLGTDGAWGSVTAVSEDLLLAIMIEGSGASTESAMYSSDDQGATWVLYATNPVDATLTWDDKGVMRHVPTSGQLVLAAQHVVSSDDRLTQWASDDLATFIEVGSVAPYDIEAWDLMVFPSGRIVLVNINASNHVLTRAVGDAFDRLGDAPESTISSSPTCDEITATVDADGTGWLLGRSSSVKSIWYLWVTTDEGRTWTLCTQSPIHTRSTNRAFGRAVSAFCRGQMVVAHNFDTSTGTYDDVLGSLWLGGWSSATGAMRDSTDRSLLSGRMGSGWHDTAPSRVLPPVEGTNTYSGITVSDTGTVSETQSAGERVIDVTSGTWEATVTPTNGGGPWVGAVRVPLSTSSSAEFRIYVRTSAREVRLVYTRTRIKIFDNTSGTADYDEPHDLSETMILWVERTESFGYKVMWRRPHESKWTVQTGTLGNVATSGNEIGWGMPSSDTATFHYGLIWIGEQFGNNDRLFATKTGTDVIGKPLGTRPYPLTDLGRESSGELVQAARVRLAGGPGLLGQTIDIDAEHDYPVEHLFPWGDPSPAKEWRSVDDESAVSIPINLGGTGGSGNYSFGPSTILLPVLRANVRTMHLQRDDGGSWTTVTTWDAATDFGASSALTSAVDGDEVTPASGTAEAGRYIQEHELVGGYYEETSSGNVYKIVACEGGVWAGSGASTHKVKLRVEGSPSGGPCRLWAHSGVVVAHNISPDEQYRLQIPVQSTAEGYFRLGLAAPAAFKPVSRQWSWEWSTDHRPQVRRIQGERTADRIEQLRPVAREITVSNPDGYLLHHLRGSSPRPQWQAADSGDTLAAKEDAPFMLSGLLREIRGGEHPVLLMMRVDDEDEVITDPTLWMYAHLVASVNLENVRGNEGVNEMQRLQSLTFREITAEPEG